FIPNRPARGKATICAGSQSCVRPHVDMIARLTPSTEVDYGSARNSITAGSRRSAQSLDGQLDHPRSGDKLGLRRFIHAEYWILHRKQWLGKREIRHMERPKVQLLSQIPCR